MNSIVLSPEDLFLGTSNTFEIEIPQELLLPAGRARGTAKKTTPTSSVVQIRPLTIGSFQTIMKAARKDAGLVPLLMIKESLVQPALTLDQVKQLQIGLVNFLIENIRQISGLTGKKD